jgi:NADH:ubiquinone oxidoreductase subunit C
VDTKELTRKLKSGAPEGSVLDVQPFGRSGKPVVWGELKSIVGLAKHLRDEPAFSFDWLENLSAMEMQNSLVLSYFLRSSGSGSFLVLRTSVVLESSEAEVEADSVCSIWPMAARMEREITDLFGIRFKGSPMKAREVLPGDWVGFPLRKSYLYPTEFQSIPHMRPAGHTGPDEYGVHS